VAPDRRDNLLEPVLGDFGAHGRFDRIAHPASAQQWLTTHRMLATLALAGVIGAAFAVRRRER
jgi:hypothetical protein